MTSKFPWPVLKVSCRDQRPLSDGIQHQQLQSHALRAWWGNQSSHDTQWLDQLLPLGREICGQSYRSVRSAFINKAEMNQTEEQPFKEQGMKENITVAVTTNLWHMCVLIYFWLCSVLLLIPREHYRQGNCKGKGQLEIQSIIHAGRTWNQCILSDWKRYD